MHGPTFEQNFSEIRCMVKKLFEFKMLTLKKRPIVQEKMSLLQVVTTTSETRVQIDVHLSP